MAPPAAAGLVAWALAWAVALASPAGQVVVRTPLGALVGEDHGSFQVFRGIPYAEPPRRFEAPVKKQPWAGVLNATAFGDACIGEGAWPGYYGSSEDCLFLNIWRPRRRVWRWPRKLPVVVVLHGGGFMCGTGSKPTYWGDTFATDSANPLILVTLNYRLGVFGFSSSQETGANAGIRDQRLALEWVRDSIAAFGGNPADVTLVGQSAGAMSALTHLASPGSRGLFHRAFLASAVGLHYRNMSENEAFVVSVAHSVGCPGSPSDRRLACLRERPAELLRRAGTTAGYLFHLVTPCQGCDNFLPWMPVVDGDILPECPLSLIRKGLHARIPTIVSSVRNESLAFVPGIIKDVVDIGEAYKLVMDVLFKSRAAEVEKHYAQSQDAGGEDYYTRIGETVTDALWTCYARYLSRLLAGAGSGISRSEFLHAPSSRADPGNRAVNALCEEGATCHGADLAWMFEASTEVQQLMAMNYTPAEHKQAHAYSAGLRAFATGRPSPWLPYDAKTDRITLWEDAPVPRETTGYRAEHCDFFESIGFVEPWNNRAASPAAASISEAGAAAATGAASAQAFV